MGMIWKTITVSIPRASNSHVVSDRIPDRKGTMVHPNFQKRGFGTVLTHHCNAISDKTRGRTFVPPRPTSVKMFNQCGFKTVGSHDSHIERLGGSVEKSKTWMAIREAPTS
jgi:citrate lyase synthetase